MARIETTISKQPAGAQRTMDFYFPSNQLYTVGTTSIGNTWNDRQATIQYGMGTVTGIGAPPAGSGWTTYRGRIAHKQTASAGTGGFFASDSNFGIHFPQLKSGLGGLFQDDFRCWRIVLVAAYDHGILNNTDLGLEVGPGFNYNILVTPNSGLAVRPSSNTTAGVVASTGGAPTIQQDVATGLDVADWNAYEMRIIGATLTTDAIWKVFINGVHVFEESWTGGRLPTMASGASLGYSVGVGNRGATTAAYTAIAGLHVSAAATEEGLL